MAGREKGSATVPCPSCGKSLAMETQADGGSAAVTCPSCFPPAKEKETAAHTPRREHGADSDDVPVKEES